MTKRSLGLLTVALVACLSLPAQGGEKEDAKRLFDAGLNLMKMEDFPAASVNFERSVALFPTQNSLFNLANCYRVMRRYGDALDALGRLQHDFGKTLKPEIATAASRQETEIRALIVRLTIQVVPSDARLTVDGKDMGTGPSLGPLVLGPGEHVIEATRTGYQALRRTTQLVSGAEATETLVLMAESGPPPITGAATSEPAPIDLTATAPAPPQDQAAPPPIYKRWWFWTAVAAVAIGAGISIFAATSGGEASGPKTKLGTQEMF